MNRPARIVDLRGDDLPGAAARRGYVNAWRAAAHALAYASNHYDSSLDDSASACEAFPFSESLDEVAAAAFEYLAAIESAPLPAPPACDRYGTLLAVGQRVALTSPGMPHVEGLHLLGEVVEARGDVLRVKVPNGPTWTPSAWNLDACDLATLRAEGDGMSWRVEHVRGADVVPAGAVVTLLALAGSPEVG